MTLPVAKKSTIKIANAAGFLGDNLDAPRLLVERELVDFLTLEHLAELTLSILARLREKDPTAGYATDLVEVIRSLTGPLRTQPQLKIVTNGGGMNPPAAAKAISKTLSEAGLADLPIAVVLGDDLLGRVEELTQAGIDFAHFDTGEPFAPLRDKLVSANAYLGADGIVSALEQEARIVITGRVADASLTVGPARHAFGWNANDWPRIAQATVAGHLIECGAQATGGLSHDWSRLDLANVGYPIAELDASGECHISKPAGFSGEVSVATLSEQLVYEIGDPAHYLTPDTDCDFRYVTLTQAGADRVRVEGAHGEPPPDTYKVSMAYRAGFAASGQLLVYGADCVAKARACAEMIRRRAQVAGFDLARFGVECLGAGEGVPGLHAPPKDLREVMLRVTVEDPRREAVERFTREFAPLITSGPPGLAGYASGRASVRPVFAYWPSRVPRELVPWKVEARTARGWLAL